MRAPPPPRKPCGHVRHIGTCPACQRALIGVHQAQLSAAAAAGATWRAGHPL